MSTRAVAVGAALVVAVAVVLLSRGGSETVTAEPLSVKSDAGIATAFAAGDGRAVTVAHAVDAGLVVGGTRAEVLRVDRRSDLALLTVPGLHGAVPEISREPVEDSRLRLGRIREGRGAWLPVEGRRAIDAHVSAPGAARPATRSAIELDTPAGAVAAGDSGAPVVTESGALAGVLFAVSRRRRDTAYAVSAGALTRLLRGR